MPDVVELLLVHRNDDLFGPARHLRGGSFSFTIHLPGFGRASILASPSLERSRMTKVPPAGYPAFLQYLQSGRVSNFVGWILLVEGSQLPVPNFPIMSRRRKSKAGESYATFRHRARQREALAVGPRVMRVPG